MITASAVGFVLAGCSGPTPLYMCLTFMAFVLPFIALGAVVVALCVKDRRLRRRWFLAAPGVALAWGILLAVLLCAPINRSRTGRKLDLNNLRLIEDAIDEVMSESNFSSTASVTVEMVGEHLKAGAVSNMNWAEGTVLPGDEMIQASESNGVFVERHGKRITIEHKHE